MRKDKELLTLVLNRLLSQGTKFGLCSVIGVMRYDCTINYEEYLHLLNMFKQNCPNKPYGYYWPEGLIKPRVEFLKQLIEKYNE